MFRLSKSVSIFRTCRPRSIPFPKGTLKRRLRQLFLLLPILSSPFTMHVHVRHIPDVLPRSRIILHLASRRPLRLIHDRLPHDLSIPRLRNTLGREENVRRWEGSRRSG